MERKLHSERALFSSTLSHWPLQSGQSEHCSWPAQMASMERKWLLRGHSSARRSCTGPFKVGSRSTVVGQHRWPQWSESGILRGHSSARRSRTGPFKVGSRSTAVGRHKLPQWSESCFREGTLQLNALALAPSKWAVGALQLASIDGLNGAKVAF